MKDLERTTLFEPRGVGSSQVENIILNNTASLRPEEIGDPPLPPSTNPDLLDLTGFQLARSFHVLKTPLEDLFKEEYSERDRNRCGIQSEKWKICFPGPDIRTF